MQEEVENIEGTNLQEKSPAAAYDAGNITVLEGIEEGGLSVVAASDDEGYPGGDAHASGVSAVREGEGCLE